MVLRNGTLPTLDVMKDRGGFNIHCLSQFAAYGLQQLCLVPVHDFGPVPAAAHRAEQDHSRRRTFRIDRRALLDAEQIAARPLWGNEAEAVEIEGYIATSITEAHDDKAVIRN